MTPLVITPASYESLGAQFAQRAGNPSSGAWPSTNRAIYIPFTLAGPAVVQKVFWANGATASGNVDCGVFSSTAGKPDLLLFSTGSTAQTGTDTDQVTDIADYLLAGGVQYFMALVESGTTGTFYRYTTPALGASILCGECQSVTSLPLASTPTYATLTVAYIPVFGLIFGTAQV